MYDIMVLVGLHANWILSTEVEMMWCDKQKLCEVPQTAKQTLQKLALLSCTLMFLHHAKELDLFTWSKTEFFWFVYKACELFIAFFCVCVCVSGGVCGGVGVCVCVCVCVCVPPAVLEGPLKFLLSCCLDGCMYGWMDAVA